MRNMSLLAMPALMTSFMFAHSTPSMLLPTRQSQGKNAQRMLMYRVDVGLCFKK